jgi:hypothetical protein
MLPVINQSVRDARAQSTASCAVLYSVYCYFRSDYSSCSTSLSDGTTLHPTICCTPLLLAVVDYKRLSTVLHSVWRKYGCLSVTLSLLHSAPLCPARRLPAICFALLFPVVLHYSQLSSARRLFIAPSLPGDTTADSLLHSSLSGMTISLTDLLLYSILSGETTANHLLYSAPLQYALSSDTTTEFTVTDRETYKVVDKAARHLLIMSDQKTDRVADKAAVSIERKRPGFFPLRKAIKLATEQPPKQQHIMRQSDILVVTDRAVDKAASSLEKKRLLFTEDYAT